MASDNHIFNRQWFESQTKASSRLALVANDMVDAVQDLIRKLRSQRDALRAELESARLFRKRCRMDVNSQTRCGYEIGFTAT